MWTTIIVFLAAVLALIAAGVSLAAMYEMSLGWLGMFALISLSIALTAVVTTIVVIQRFLAFAFRVDEIT